MASIVWRLVDRLGPRGRTRRALRRAIVEYTQAKESGDSEAAGRIAERATGLARHLAALYGVDSHA